MDHTSESHPVSGPGFSSVGSASTTGILSRREVKHVARDWCWEGRKGSNALPSKDSAGLNRLYTQSSASPHNPAWVQFGEQPL